MPIRRPAVGERTHARIYPEAHSPRGCRPPCAGNLRFCSSILLLDHLAVLMRVHVRVRMRSVAAVTSADLYSLLSTSGVGYRVASPRILGSIKDRDAILSLP